jgi:hypothetical protein
LLLEGDALLDEIDDFVDLWHDGNQQVSLNEFLGMSVQEYSLWLQEPDMLAHIVRARRYDLPLPEIINDNYSELRLAARATDTSKARRLGRWLQQQGFLD